MHLYIHERNIMENFVPMLYSRCFSLLSDSFVSSERGLFDIRLSSITLYSLLGQIKLLFLVLLTEHNIESVLINNNIEQQH